MATSEHGAGPAAGEGTGGTRVRALILWVLVLIALLYGVVATAIKIPALFG